MYDTCLKKSGSARKAMGRFWHKFWDTAVPCGETFCRTANKLRQTGWLLAKRKF
jgi:hypothetical protein